MGVPSFYRWLTNKYESTVVNAKEENGECIDSSLPNPNGMEFDHLYLDMNGIIHPCFHPDDVDDMLAPKTFDEVFQNIFSYIDRLFNIVRPRKLLYMAIDGVAPRAKMNQQRTRRFRTAKDAEELAKEEDRLRKQFLLEGKQVLPKQETELSDTNIITPGTEFMYKLSKDLQIYIELRMKYNPGWKNVKVLLSDSNVPGEGEHKIFSFIRLQRTFPEYDPNTRHCVYGLDADLIMLVLATHEIHFSILREDVLAQLPNSSEQITQKLAISEPENMTKSRGWFKKWGETGPSEKSSSEAVTRTMRSAKRPYQFVHSWILREYLEIDLKISNPPDKFEPDFERLVDDFIFMCFFMGNDFLPHMPSLSIHEGGIDLLMHVYKTEFKSFGGYLVDMQYVEEKKSRYIKLKRAEKFILLVGNYEDEIFKKRANLRERTLRRILNEYEDNKCAENQDLAMNEIDLSTLQISPTRSGEIHTSSVDANDPDLLQNTKELKEKLKAYSRKAADNFQNGGFGTDKVKLSLPGHKERYYKEKFGVINAADIESTRKAVVEKYTEGLCWVTLYYFAGVPSWTWYYPYHYAPFASDMKGISQVKPHFQKGVPFKPFEQLMGVFPPRSAHALPLPYRRLMTDEDSNIIKFYPTDFPIDVDGKRYMWQGTCQLPFIEEALLLAETRKLESDLKDDEVIRNSEGQDLLFLGKTSSQIICNIPSTESSKQDEVKIEARVSGGLNGFMLFKSGEKADGLPCSDDNILCVYYKLPPHKMHYPRLLEGVNIPEKRIDETDIHETQLWHEYQGHRPDTRMPNPHRQWKTEKKSSDSTPAVIIKNAGTGWGGGRGRGITEEAKRRSSAPGVTQNMRSSSNFGRHSGMIPSRPEENWNSPLQHNNNGKWKPSGFGRGMTEAKQTFKPQQPQLYNVQQVINRAETNSPWRGRNFGRGETRGPGAFVPAHNNARQAMSSVRGQTQGAWTITPNQRADNNVWRAMDSATQGAWTLKPTQQANTNVWRATSSSMGTQAATTFRPNLSTTNNFWRSSETGRGGNWRTAERQTR